MRHVLNSNFCDTGIHRELLLDTVQPNGDRLKATNMKRFKSFSNDYLQVTPKNILNAIINTSRFDDAISLSYFSKVCRKKTDSSKFPNQARKLGNIEIDAQCDKL